MKRKHLLWLSLVTLWLCTSTWADDIRVVSSGGFAAAYKVLAPQFEAQTGHHLVVAWGPSMGETPHAIPQRLKRGEPMDVVIMVGDALEGLIQQGQVDREGHRTLALSKISMAVRAGTTPPDISTVEALRQTLLHASSVAYSDSASGEYLSKVLFPQLGVAEALRDKGHKIPAEPVGQVVARGEAEIGFQQTAELMPINGITLVGEIPASVQHVTPFAAGIVASSSVKPAAQALIDYLSSAKVASEIQKTGLTPSHSTP